VIDALLAALSTLRTTLAEAEAARRAPEAVLIVLVGVLLGRVGALALSRVLSRSGHLAFAHLGAKAVAWGGGLVGLAMALERLGLDLSVLLGAAGVFTVAIGFASQTSASNLISGLFLMLEHSVEVGDNIRVGTVEGEVLSIDLLSLKLRTWDNRLVRVPNETLVKSEIVNLSRFPIRRLDLDLRLPLDGPLAPLCARLAAVVEADPRVLQEPPPQVLVRGLVEAWADVHVSCWVRREALIEVRSALLISMLGALAADGVEIPVPGRAPAPPSPPAR
jgi:small-conductance mechanosensitive channel